MTLVSSVVPPKFFGGEIPLELLKIKTPEPEPVIANDSNEMIRNGNKYVFNEQMGSWLKVVDPFSAVYTKKRPDQ